MYKCHNVQQGYETLTDTAATARIGIMAAHEQVNATELLTDVVTMEENKLERCWVSDHYMPWWHDGGFAGATWPWLGAALARTNEIEIGTSVTAPIDRRNHSWG